MARKKTVGASKGRKSKAESMTEAKANSVEVRTAAGGIGDNSGELALPKPDDWDHHFRSIKGLAERAATANSHLRHAKTAAKKSGIDMDAMNRALAEDRDPDPVKLRRFVEQLGLGLKQLGSHVAITVHDTSLGDSEDLAQERGFQNGEAGKTYDNPYPAGTSLHARYHRGHMYGQGKVMNLTPEQVDANLANDAEWDEAAPKDTPTPAEGGGGDAFGLPPTDAGEQPSIQ